MGERLQPTLDMAQIEREKYATKAKLTGYALNAAIGLQVLLGSLTTGLSAVTTGRQVCLHRWLVKQEPHLPGLLEDFHHDDYPR